MDLQLGNQNWDTMLELLTHNGKQGTGYYDTLMRSMATHLEGERELGRISPAEYAQVYVQLAGTILQGSIQYLMGVPQIAISLKELEIKEQELENAKKQNELIDAQIKKLLAETAQIQQGTLNMTEQGKALVFETVSAQHKSEAMAHETEATKFKALAMEYRADAEYAVTHSTLPDGSAIGGSLGKDNEVKDAQVTSFKAKNLYQMISGLQSSNTAQVTTLGDISIAPNYTTQGSLDTAVNKYFTELGVPFEPTIPPPPEPEPEGGNPVAIPS